MITTLHLKFNPSTINFKMDNRSEIEQKLGTSLGEKGSDRKSVVETFRGKGLSKLNHTSISRLKAGMISGERTDWRLDTSRILEKDNAGLKNTFYEQITQVGLQERRFNTAPQRAHVLKSDHYVEDVAKALGQDPQVLRRCIRGMRADMALTQVDSPNSDLFRQFSEATERFIDSNHRLPPSMHSPGVNRLDQVWDHITVEDFYRNIYAVSDGRRTIGSWTPYEMETLSRFYKQQIAQGNHLTPLDRLVLDSYTNGAPASSIVAEVVRSTGIAIDEQVIEQHRNVLVYGRPVYRPNSK